MSNRVLNAAQAAIDADAFHVARDILARSGVKLCVLCLKREPWDSCTFREEELPVCFPCAQRDGTSSVVAPSDLTPDYRYLSAGVLWVRDYRGYKHYSHPSLIPPRWTYGAQHDYV